MTRPDSRTNMRRRDWKAKAVRESDRPHRCYFGSRALAISQMFLPDLLANRYDNAFPSDHRSKAECNCNRCFHPVRYKFGRIVETLFVGAKCCNVLFRKIVLIVLQEETDGLGGEIHVVTGVAHLRCRDLPHRAIGL